MHHLTFFAKRQRGEYKSRPVSVPYFTHHIKPQSRTHSALDAVAQTGSKAQRLNDLPTIEAHAAGVCGCCTRHCTVRNRAIEINSQEAVSRFLNMHGKSQIGRTDGASQSISKCTEIGPDAYKVGPGA